MGRCKIREIRGTNQKINPEPIRKEGVETMYFEKDSTQFDTRVEFKGFIIGCVLGGNSLGMYGEMRTANFTASHAISQKDYCKTKAKLASYLTKIRYDENDKYAVFQTMTHPFYTKLRDHFYFGDRVSFDEHVMKLLTPLGLAMWYQNDGNYSHEKKNKSYYLPVVRLCSRFGDSKVENEFLQYWLKKRFGIAFKIHSNVTYGKRYWMLRLRRMEEIEKFMDLVKPWIVESMKYKTPDGYTYKVIGTRRDSPAVLVKPECNDTQETTATSL